MYFLLISDTFDERGGLICGTRLLTPLPDKATCDKSCGFFE